MGVLVVHGSDGTGTARRLRTDADGALMPPMSIASTTVAQTSVGTTADEILFGNEKRKRFMVQNTGTTVIKLGLGRTPTATAYHVALKACASADDGSGGMYIDEMWRGDVTAISSAAGGTCVVTELT